MENGRTGYQTRTTLGFPARSHCLRRCYAPAHRKEAEMTRTVSVDEAQGKLQDLLAQALASDENSYHRKTENRLRDWFQFRLLMPNKRRVAGLNRGTIWTSEDFDGPLPDGFWLGQE